MSFTFCTLFSGSSGNCAYVGGENGGLLVDCGLSGKATLEALHQAGISPYDVRAVLVTHEHIDHTKGVGILARKLNVPVYATRGTWEGMARAVGELPSAHRVVVTPGESFFPSDIEAAPFSIPHDAAEPVGYRFFLRGHSVAVATDMGYFSPTVEDAICGSELVLLESNHDPELLKNNPNYSFPLKRRILSRHGHLCNQDSAAAAVRLLETGTRHLLLGHLSQENNTPELAYNESYAALCAAGANVGTDVTLFVAGRSQISHIYRG